MNYIFDFTFQTSTLTPVITRNAITVIFEFKVDKSHESIQTQPQSPRPTLTWNHSNRFVIDMIDTTTTYLNCFLYITVPGISKAPKLAAFSKIPLSTFPSVNPKTYKIPLVDPERIRSAPVAHINVKGTLSSYYLPGPAVVAANYPSPMISNLSISLNTQPIPRYPISPPQQYPPIFNSQNQVLSLQPYFNYPPNNMLNHQL